MSSISEPQILFSNDLKQIKRYDIRPRDLKRRNYMKMTPLFWAIFNGNDDIADYFINKGADVNDMYNGETVLSMTIRLHNNFLAKRLLEKGASIWKTSRIEYPPPFNDLYNYEADFPIKIAVLYNNYGIIDYILNRWEGTDVDDRGLGDMTPLWYAIYGNFISIIKILLDHGANVNVSHRRNPSPISLTIKENKLDILEILCPYYDHEYKLITAVDAAAYYNNIDALKILLKFNFDINEHYSHGTALSTAVEYADYIMVEFLLENGADPNIPGIKHKTPIFYAINENDRDKLQLLIHYSANVNFIDYEHNTPLHKATANDIDINIIKILLTNGADPSLINKKGYTPYLNACENENLAAIKLLIGFTDINETDNKGNNAIHLARNCPDCVKFLVDNGVNIRHQNNDGYTYSMLLLGINP